MHNPLQEMIEEALTLPPIPLREIDAYHECSAALVHDVNEALRAHASIHSLIGNNPLQVMYDNHKHHAAFMATVFRIQSYELLVRTVPWVYRSYHAHRFSYEYFPRELEAWISAIRKHSDQPMDTIVQVYRWLLSKHAVMMGLADSDMPCVPPVSDAWLEQKNAFQAGLQRGDHQACLALARELVHQCSDVAAFYLYIIQPAMYEIGLLWERAIISVAQEHLASAIVSRVMAGVNMLVSGTRPSRGKAVIASAPDEFHEIGGWMIADILACEGWDVRYLGANTPQDALISLLADFKPEALGLSVTMAFNIEKTRAIIDTIRKHPELKTIRIIVGGRVFNENPEIWRILGADAWAANLSHALKLFMPEGLHV